jgi:hypothetical protein
MDALRAALRRDRHRAAFGETSGRRPLTGIQLGRGRAREITRLDQVVVRAVVLARLRPALRPRTPPPTPFPATRPNRPISRADGPGRTYHFPVLRPPDTDAVVEDKGVAQPGRRLCGRHQRHACPRAMRPAAHPRIARELAVVRFTARGSHRLASVAAPRACRLARHGCRWGVAVRGALGAALRRFALELRLLRRNRRDLRCATLGGTWRARRRLHRYGHLLLGCHRCLLFDLTNVC